MSSVRDLTTWQSEMSHDFEWYLRKAPTERTVLPWSHKHTALGFNILSGLKPGLKPEWEQWALETERSAKTHHTPNIYLKWWWRLVSELWNINLFIVAPPLGQLVSDWSTVKKWIILPSPDILSVHSVVFSPHENSLWFCQSDTSVSEDT